LLRLDKNDVKLLYEKEALFFTKYPEYAHLQDIRKNYYKLDRLQGLQKSIMLDLIEMGAYQESSMRNLLLSIVGNNLASIDTNLIPYVNNFTWLNGIKWSERLWNNNDKLRSKLNEYLNDGFLRGDSINTIIKEVKNQFNVSYNDASRLILTESSAIHNTSTLDRYKAMGVTQVEFSSVMDDRTSETCNNSDGEIIDIDDVKIGVNAPPLHPYCRSVLLPVIDSIKQLHNEELSNEETKGLPNTMLTDKEQYAINTYISSESYKINDMLRNGGEVPDYMQEIIKNLDSALDKLPKYEGNVVRDLNFSYNEQERKKFLDSLEVGNNREFLEYLSSSPTGKYHESPDVVIRIISKNGRDLRGDNLGEQEILFKRNSIFKVLYKHEADGKIVVYLEEV